MQESVTPNATTRAFTAWSVATCVLFRFPFAYVVLFAPPYIEGFVPYTARFTRTIDQLWFRVTPLGLESIFSA